MADDTEDEKAPDGKKGIGRWTLFFGIVPALVSLTAAGFSFVSAQQAGRRADDLERTKMTQEGQFRVYDRVERQLSDPQPYKLVVASAYLQLVEDVAIRRTLCETIGSIAFDQLQRNENGGDRSRIQTALRDVVRVARDCAEAMSFERPTQAASAANGNPSVPSNQTDASVVVAQASRQAPVTAVVSNAGASPTGWDIDVFWCTSQGERSRALATRVATRLATSNLRIGNETLGRVRLRSVDADAQRRLQPARGNPVVGTPDERGFAEAVAGTLNQANVGANFFYSPTAAVTRWYISIFACGFES
jgi:hypothetical protein